MNSLWHCRKNRAFTLVEMLVVIAIIAILAAMLLPALVRGKQRAQRVQCIGELKDLGTAFSIFAHDHQSRFPMQLSRAEGGSEEFVTAGNSIPGPFYFSFRHLQSLANELVIPRILVCPTDRAREPARAFGALQNSNVSFFVGVFADYNDPASILAGDRNITNNAATASLVRGSYGLSWTDELHFYKGNILFSDTHVGQMNNTQMQFPKRTMAGIVLALPAVKTTYVASAAPVAREKPRPVAITPTPATDDDYEPPLVWLQGAVQAGIAKSGGWFWLLLLLLIAAAVYGFSRKKKRPLKKR